MKCHIKIDEEQQKKLFKTFYDLPDWTRKTLFLRSSVKRSAVKQKLSDRNPIIQQKNRNYNYSYELFDSAGDKQDVCGNFFFTCLQINSKRVYRAINTTQSNSTAKDNRGRGPSKNKTNERDKGYVNDFISKFPKYKSHYGRKDSDKDYLAPNLNIRKIYKEYKAVTEFRQRVVLSEHKFREIFNTEFNLAFKRTKTDTCKTCDEINAKINSRNWSGKNYLSQIIIKLFL